MDFLDPAKKRKNGIKLFIGYFLVGVGILLAAVILISLAYGYSLDRKTGTVIQNGIVFVSSRPTDAKVFFNGVQYKDNTDVRAVLPSSDYRVTLARDGYRPWERDFFLAGGSIERMVYPMLFPDEIKTSTVTTYKATPAFSTQSPDRRWLVVQQVAARAEFELYDLNQTAPIARKLTIPAAVLTGKTKSFSLVEWSNDNRHVLLKHSTDKGYEFVILDREQPSQSLNVNTLTKAAITTMSLKDKKFNDWYLHNSKSLELSTASVARPQPRRLIEGVAAYKTHGTDIILYATTAKAAKGKARVLIWDEGRTDLLREVAASKRYLLDVARFDNRWYFGVGAAADGKVYVYENPFDTIRSAPRQELIPATIMRLKDPEFISFSQNTRFISVQARGEFAVYDAETERAYRYNTDLAFQPGNKAVWMDGHRLSGVVEDDVVVFDFDGINKQVLTGSVPGLLPYFSADYEELFTIAPKASSKEADLLRGALILEQ